MALRSKIIVELSAEKLRQINKLIEHPINIPCRECTECEIGYTERCRNTTSVMFYAVKVGRQQVPTTKPDVYGNVSASVEIDSIEHEGLLKLKRQYAKQRIKETP